MSGFSFDANVVRPDINRIVKKLTAVHKAASPKSNSVIIRFILRQVLEDYVESAVSVMGVVSSDGGTVTPKGMMGVTKSMTWEPLAQKTVDKKFEATGSAEIWAYTGAAKDGVKIHTSTTTNQSKMFAGLQPSDGAAYYHAWRTETGQFAKGRQVARPLFTVLNDIFRYNIPVIVKEINKLLVHEAKWGT